MGISVGVVGIGSFGQHFVRLFRDHPQVDRAALCDINAERLSQAAKRFEVAETYASLDEICRSDLDALAIITQPWLHAPQAIQAMEAGMHVYSAVPVVMLSSGDEMLDWTDRIVRTCEKTGMHYMMGETSYYHPQAMYCRRRAGEGAFGRFVLAEGEYLHDVDSPGCNLREVARSRWGDEWDDSKRGGVPMHYPTHSIGGFLSAMPAERMTRVAAVGYVHPDDDWYRKDTCWQNEFSNETALFSLSNGAVARICEYRRIGHRGREGFQLFGTDGSFLDSSGGCCWVTKAETTPLTVEDMRDPLPEAVVDAYTAAQGESFYGGHGGSHAYLVHEFVDAVDAGRPPAINAWVAARFFAPGVVAHKSALRGGEWLDVPDWGDGPE